MLVALTPWDTNTKHAAQRGRPLQHKLGARAVQQGRTYRKHGWGAKLRAKAKEKLRATAKAKAKLRATAQLRAKRRRGVKLATPHHLLIKRQRNLALQMAGKSTSRGRAGRRAGHTQIRSAVVALMCSGCIECCPPGGGRQHPPARPAPGVPLQRIPPHHRVHAIPASTQCLG